MKHNSKLNEIKTYSKVQIIKLEKCQNEYIELLNEYQSMYMFIQVQVCSYQKCVPIKTYHTFEKQQKHVKQQIGLNQVNQVMAK